MTSLTIKTVKWTRLVQQNKSGSNNRVFYKYTLSGNTFFDTQFSIFVIEKFRVLSPKRYNISGSVGRCYLKKLNAAMMEKR